MKKLLPLFVAFLCTQTYAQDFDVVFKNTNIYGTPQTPLVAKGYVKNMTGATTTFRWSIIGASGPNAWTMNVRDTNQTHDNTTGTSTFTLKNGDSGVLEIHVFPNNQTGMARCTLDVIKENDPFDILEGIFTFHAWTAGFDDPVYPAGFTVFPNPANNTLNISLKEDAAVTLNIYNTLGQLQLQHLHNAQTSEINLAPLQPGLYFIKYTTENRNTVSEKFFKAE